MTRTKQRPWTMGDVKRLTAMKYADRTNAEVADALGRSKGAVREAWRDYGNPAPLARLAGREGAVRRLYSEGLSAAEISRRLCLGKSTLLGWLRRLGLKPHGNSAASRAARSRENYARQCKGLSLGVRVLEVWKCRAAGAGWPDADTPRQVKILGLLEGVRRTAAGLAAGLGLATRTARCHLANLQRKGLVVAATRRQPALYALAPGVRRRRPEDEYGGTGPRPERRARA